MRPALVLAALLLVALAPAFAGCACAKPAVSARGVTGAPSAAGRGGFTLDVTVVDGLTGAPLADAGVVAYWSGDNVGSWSAPRVDVSGSNGPDGQKGRVVVDPGATFASPSPQNALRMDTDATGAAHASVPADIIVGVVAAKAGYTEEWVPAVASGGGGNGALTVTLYPSRLSGAMEGAWGPGAASTGIVTDSQYTWKPAPMPVTNDSEAQRALAARIVELRVSVVWNNSVQGYGDLGIGVGPDPGRGPTYFQNPTRDATPGEHAESVTVAAKDLVEHGIVDAPAVYVGPAVDAGFFAPQGLPYSVHVDARIEGTGDVGFPCNGQAGGRAKDDSAGFGAKVPGFGAPAAVVAAVAALALISRRR